MTKPESAENPPPEGVRHHFANDVACPVCKAPAGTPCEGSEGWAHFGRVVDHEDAQSGEDKP